MKWRRKDEDEKRQAGGAKQVRMWRRRMRVGVGIGGDSSGE